jgi:hypothetical protein
VRRQKNILGKLFRLVLLFSLFLSSCLSMQIDITPEPDSIKADGIVDTPIQSQAPTQNSPQPTISLEAEGIEGEVIVVNVIDQTGGMLLEQGLEVQLEGYDQFELVYQDTKPLTTESRSVFDSVPFQAGRVFFASISHGGAIYRSDMFEAGDETTSMQMAIQIFETTTSDENILVERIHVLADFPSPYQVQIVEIFIVSNLGDSTYVADSPGEATLSFPLPAEAGSISFDDGALGERYVKTVDGFGDTVSIPPGAGVYQTLVYYTLPIQENTFEFSQVMSYSVRAAVIMTPEGEVIVEGANLEDMGVQAIPDGSVQVYSAMSIPRGESLQFRVTVESTESVVPSDAPVFLPQWVIIAAGVLGGALLLTGVWLFIRQRSRGFEDVEFEETSVEREEILDSIIALEDLYQEGDITEKAYLKKRQELKDQLDSLADD